MNDKIIGIVMIFSSFAIAAFLFVWTILLPIIENQISLKYYLALAIVVFIVIFIFLILMAWIGWNFLRTRAPKEGMIGDISEKGKIEKKKDR